MIIYKVKTSYEEMTSDDFTSNVVSEKYFDSEEKAKKYQEHIEEQYKDYNDENYFDECAYNQYSVILEKIIVR